MTTNSYINNHVLTWIKAAIDIANGSYDHNQNKSGPHDPSIYDPSGKCVHYHIQWKVKMILAAHPKP